MSHAPPVPQGNVSPYPLRTPPHAPAPSTAGAARPPVTARRADTPVPVGALVAFGVAAVAGIAAVALLELGDRD